MRIASLLRGINVSGQKKIKMADLKSLYEEQGFENVITYIQSGNVIFDSKSRNLSAIKQQIEKAIVTRYNFDVPVIVRSITEFKKIVKKCPFKSIDPELEGSKVLVSLLSGKPSKENVAWLLEYVVEPEQLIVQGREVYLRCPGGYGKSKLSNSFIENKLGVEATTRNWKTMLKIIEISSQDAR